MITQTSANRTNADHINFENYALLYDELTTTQADLDEESCPLPYWGIFPGDRELSSLWTEVISAGRSLAEFLDASDENYSLPTSPMIIVARDAMTVWRRRPFDNHELLQRNFPPSTRPELENHVLRFTEVLMAYYKRLMAKVRDILFSTRIHERLVSKGVHSILLLGSLILDEANFQRFRHILPGFADGDDCDFDHFEAVQDGYESLKAALEAENPYYVVTDPEATVFPLLRAYIADADSYREEILACFVDHLNFRLCDWSRLNPRWSYPGEPSFHREEARDEVSSLR